MAAKTVSFSPLRPGHVVMRSTLDAPFKLKWPEVPPEIAARISLEMQRSFTLMVPPARKKKRSNSKVTQPPDSTQEQAPGTDKHDCSQQDDPRPKPAPFNAAKRAQVVVGLTVLSKHLERDRLRVGVVSALAPSMMLQSILMLAATRGVPCVCLPDLSSVVGLLGVKRSLAVGIKKLNPSEEDYFSELVSAVSSMAPSISIPWFSVPVHHTGTLKMEVSAEMDSEKELNSAQASTKPALSNVVGKRSRKRRRGYKEELNEAAAVYDEGSSTLIKNEYFPLQTTKWPVKRK